MGKVLSNIVSLVQNPIRRGVIGPSLMVEELGRRRVNGGVRIFQFFVFPASGVSLHLHMYRGRLLAQLDDAFFSDGAFLS